MDTKATSFEEVHALFYDFGLDLITPIEEFVKNIGSLDTYKFIYTGPCGHTRIGSIYDIQKICTHCIPMYNESGIKTIVRSRSIS
jgi:hypothetical protein